MEKIKLDEKRYKDYEAMKALSKRLNDMDIIEKAYVTEVEISFKYKYIDKNMRACVLEKCPITNYQQVYLMTRYREKDNLVVHTEAYSEDDFIYFIKKAYKDILNGK